MNQFGFFQAQYRRIRDARRIHERGVGGYRAHSKCERTDRIKEHRVRAREVPKHIQGTQRERAGAYDFPGEELRPALLNIVFFRRPSRFREPVQPCFAWTLFAWISLRGRLREHLEEDGLQVHLTSKVRGLGVGACSLFDEWKLQQPFVNIELERRRGERGRDIENQLRKVVLAMRGRCLREF
jgi:hypothetical protein